MSLVDEELEVDVALDIHRKRSRLFSWLRGRRSLSDTWDEQTQSAVHVVMLDKVAVREIERLPKGHNTLQEKMQQVDTLFAIVRADEENREKTAKPYDLGLILADLLEVIPADRAAEISINPTLACAR